MKNALVFSQLEAREFFMYIITLVSCSLFGFSSLRWLGMHLVLFQGSLSLDYYVSISRTSTILFFGVLRQYLADVCDSFLLDCYVIIAHILGILFHLAVISVSQTLWDTPSFENYVSISRIFWIVLHFIVTLAVISCTFRLLFYLIVALLSRAPLGFSFI